jgi:PAS domain S-box-containing protein
LAEVDSNREEHSHKSSRIPNGQPSHAEKKAEQLAELDAVLNAVADPVVIYDERGSVQKVNEAAREIYGFDPTVIDRAVSIKRLNARHIDGRSYTVEELPSTRALKGEHVLSERLKTNNLYGSEVIFEESALPIYAGEAIIGAVMVLHDITEQEHALLDIRESRKQVLDVLESISDGFFALDSLWRFTYINSKAQQLLGIVKEDVLFKGIWDKLPNAQVLRLYKEFTGAASQKTAASFEEFIPPLGRWFEFHVYPYENGLSIYFSDVTERKHVEEQLRRYQLFAQSARDILLFVRKSDGRIIEANDSAISAYQYSKDELLSMSVFDLRVEAQGLVTEQIEKAAAEGILFETTHRRKDGRTFPVEVSSRQAEISGEHILVSVIRDITKRKQTEDALKKSEQRYRELVEQSPDGLFVQIGDRVVYANTRATELLGAKTPDELIGRSIFSLFNEEYHELIRARIEQLLQGKPVGLIGENMIRLDGTSFSAEVAAAPIMYDNKPAIQVIFRASITTES